MGGDGLLALRLESGEGRRVTVSTHCELRGEFAQVVAEGELMKEEVCV